MSLACLTPRYSQKRSTPLSQSESTSLLMGASNGEGDEPIYAICSKIMREIAKDAWTNTESKNEPTEILTAS